MLVSDLAFFKEHKWRREALSLWQSSFLSYSQIAKQRTHLQYEMLTFTCSVDLGSGCTTWAKSGVVTLVWHWVWVNRLHFSAPELRMMLPVSMFAILNWPVPMMTSPALPKYLCSCAPRRNFWSLTISWLIIVLWYAFLWQYGFFNLCSHTQLSIF